MGIVLPYGHMLAPYRRQAGYRLSTLYNCGKIGIFFFFCTRPSGYVTIWLCFTGDHLRFSTVIEITKRDFIRLETVYMSLKKVARTREYSFPGI
jgi:hypothetical protein